tara:strand:- start:338 stop:814 length:477 start_codon:yes stop_codon:yes gene_type:complete
MGTLNVANLNHTGDLTTQNANVNGNLFTPNRPIFSLGSGNGLGNSTSWLNDTIYYNRSANIDTVGGWDSTTGEYTIPVAGHYLFYFSGCTSDTDSHFLEMFKNGSMIHATRMLNYGVIYQGAHLTHIDLCAVGDTITWRRRAANYDFYSLAIGCYLIG